jgi:hypothetical protein
MDPGFHPGQFSVVPAGTYLTGYKLPRTASWATFRPVPAGLKFGWVGSHADTKALGIADIYVTAETLRFVEKGFSLCKAATIQASAVMSFPQLAKPTPIPHFSNLP